MGRKGCELTPSVKSIIVNMYQQGKKISSFSNLLDIPRSTVDYIVNKFNCTGSAENLKRKPRQRLNDDRGARILGRLVNSDRKAPLNEITARFECDTGCESECKDCEKKTEIFWLSESCLYEEGCHQGG